MSHAAGRQACNTYVSSWALAWKESSLEVLIVCHAFGLVSSSVSTPPGSGAKTPRERAKISPSRCLC